MLRILLVLLLSFIFQSAFANDLNSPIGEWITISDKTNEKSGIVEIYDDNGKLNGKIVKVFPGNNRNPNDLCQNCPNEFKDKPIQGLEFLWDFAQKDDVLWNNGKVLDPKNGKIYKGTIKLVDGGKKLELRGYWGPFSRKQTWLRTD